ncbi:heavy metal-associated domain-containing protein [Streptomyces sp. NPDC056527]|uniref:heavy-metal-associated domain-containing protein n=1 Tax=Streptomyces sp. NPDC056527 TaxID=3345853 RepID=UPI0036A00D59
MATTGDGRHAPPETADLVVGGVTRGACVNRVEENLSRLHGDTASVALRPDPRG